MKRSYLPRDFAPLLLILSGCHPDSENPERHIVGTVQRLPIEGGCWVIDTNTGRLQPLGLPEEFRREGLTVSATIRNARDTLTTCQAGSPIRIEKIEVLR